MNQLIVSDGQTTVVDSSEYDLTIREAAEMLLAGDNIIVRDFPSFGTEDWTDQYPGPEELSHSDFKGLSLDQVVEYLRTYEAYGKLNAL